MFEELKHFNITQEIQSIKVPIYFFVSTYEIVTPTVLVENF